MTIVDAQTPAEASRVPGKASKHFHFVLDEPSAWPPDTRHVRLRGWCVAKSGQGNLRIRAVLGSELFPGRFDQDRPDVVAYLGMPDIPLRCGFTLDLRVPLGKCRMQLQATQEDNKWETVFAREMKGRRSADSPGRSALDSVLALPQTRFDLWFDRPSDWSDVHSPLPLFGWLVDHDGGWIHGVRVRVGSEIFTGTHGIVREDVAELYPHLPAARRSGFACCVELPEAATELILEILQVDGVWRPLSLAKTGVPGKRPGEAVALDPDEAVFLRPETCPPRFEFSVDAPLVWDPLEREVHVAGWCLATYGEAIAKLRARVGKTVFPARYGIVRPDIALAFEGRGDGLRSGFTAEISLPAGRSTVVLEAQSENGAWERFFQTTARVPWFGRRRTGVREAVGDYAGWIARFDTVSQRDRASIERHLASFSAHPRFSVLIPTFNSDAKWLRRAINSVRAQFYPHWELCIVDDASTNLRVWRLLKAAARREPRIKLRRREIRGHICAASNDALALATGEFVALLDHDDELAPGALYFAAEQLNREPQQKLIYSDEDKLDRAGRRCQPHFKSGWNPDLLRSQNYVSHLGIYERALVLEAGGFRQGFEGAQDYDLILRCSEKLSPVEIGHIPRVLYHWRMAEGSTSGAATAKPYANDSALRALQEHLDRTNPGARAEVHHQIYLRAKYPLPRDEPLVSLIIPTRDRARLLSSLVASLLEKTAYRNFEILILDNDSQDPATSELLANLPTRDPRIRVLAAPGPFNYSRLNNLGVAAAQGSFVVLMNNDLEVMNGDWLGEMLSQAARPGIGAVGARLWYPDGTLQHGGVIVGAGGVASHVRAGTRWDDGYFSRPHLAQNYSAVTGACMLLRTETYRAIGGLDEEKLAVAFNDVDFCLRLTAAGYRVVWTPHAEFVHHESASRGIEDTADKQRRFLAESQAMREKWGDLLGQDPFYNPNLSLGSELFQLAFPPRVENPWTTVPPAAN